MKEPCVYVLASQPYGTLYIGVTSDLIARLWQHRSGEAKGFTSKYRVHHLVRFEQFGDMYEAIAREKQLKRWHRQWKINLIESENPHGLIWPRRLACLHFRHAELVSASMLETPAALRENGP